MSAKDIVVAVFSLAIKIVIIVIAAMFIYKYALLAYDYGYRIFSEKPMSSGEGRIVSVTIQSDMDVEEIGTLLENKGLIRDSVLFRLQERLSENHGKIKPGTYDLTTAMTAEEMINVMSGSDEAEEEEVTENYIQKEMEENGFNSSEEEMDDLEEIVDMESIEGFEVEEE